METGVEVEADRQAFELALGTMVVQTSWVQLEELSPDLLLPSLGFEEEGLQEGGLDRTICSSPGERHPRLEPQDPGTSRHTWGLDESGGRQSGPLPVCKTSVKLTGRSVCPESTRLCCLAPWRLCLLLHSESLEYAELSRIHLLPGLLPTVRVPEWSEQGSVWPPRLLIYATAVVLSKRKWTCLGTGS